MNEEDNLKDPYESELKKEKEAEKKRIEEAKDDLTEGKIRRKRTEEEEKVNWSSPESGYTKEIDYESIIDDVQNLPFGVVPLTWKDGTTTYSYRGKEYSNPYEIPAATLGTVSRYDWIDKAGEFVGNVIQSSPTLRTVLPPIGKALSLLESPHTESFANLVADGAANWGIDPRIGEGLSYFAIPDATDTIKPTSKFLSKLVDDVLVNPSYSKFDKNWVENRMLSKSNITSSGSGGTKFIHSVYPKRTKGLYKQLDNQGLLDQAEKIIKDLDAFKNTEGKIQNYAKWNPDRPTTGFKGNRTVKYIDSAGNPSEVAFRWSVTKNTYVPYDLVKRQNTILKRMRWNVNRSPKAKWYSDRVYSIAKQDNTTLKKLLLELRAENPQRFFDIMGDTRHYATNKGFIFVEHIHAQNSPYWKYYTKQKFKPRDTSNLMIVKNEEFGKLKTAIEGEIYNNKNFKFPEGKRLLLDYDKKRDVLVLKQLQDTGRLKWVGDISPITNPKDWRKALAAALRGHKIEPGKMGEIQQVIQAETDIPKHVDMIDKITDWKKKDPYE